MIAKRMRERQVSAGKEYGKGIADDQKIHTYSDKTTTRKELANIAGTSEASKKSLSGRSVSLFRVRLGTIPHLNPRKRHTGHKKSATLTAAPCMRSYFAVKDPENLLVTLTLFNRSVSLFGESRLVCLGCAPDLVGTVSLFSGRCLSC